MAKTLRNLAPTLGPSGRHDGARTAARLAGSAWCGDGVVTATAEFRRWYAERESIDVAEVQRIPLSSLEGWETLPGSGNIAHRSGRFFTVEGLEVRSPGAPVPAWQQPIINQPEIGILGILAREFDGVLHFLMQAKNEPGNCNGVQLSPTVQATRSNYTRVHGGNSVPYLEYFQAASRHRVQVDVLQSEQGSWFFRKRNRNIVVEVEEDVEVLDGFRWLTLGQLHGLLAIDDLVNMDARTVLACLPFAGPGQAGASSAADDGLGGAIRRSCDEEVGSLHTLGEVQSWITEARAGAELRTATLPLGELKGWSRSEYAISHEDGLYFDIMAVEVKAGSREVSRWTQPMIEPRGTGIVAFLVTRIDGVLHVLVQPYVRPGHPDAVELGPTVQCTPGNYAQDALPARLRFLPAVREAAPERVLFDTTLSEEGGRFFHARNRYMVVETDAGPELEDPLFRWVTLHQVAGLLRHAHYLNIEARSLIACLHSLIGRS
ncbi:NDP-hexose 2,3-dehydratase family protein [Spirillospora sp. CA-294931]|uniref:NDP-hexose 2,3-dehydratase family protein n=1 Tax=Spirillospora sp. CA-294931 TaxID=3240042 RepID=UPI003D905639